MIEHRSQPQDDGLCYLLVAIGVDDRPVAETKMSKASASVWKENTYYV